MPALGISRVTDITRMDRLGLPVFASIRPTGRLLRVHSGKGLRSIDSRVGALMEAIEFAAAEPDRSDWDRRAFLPDELEARWKGDMRLRDFAPLVTARRCPRQRIETVECEEIGGRSPADLPAELVFAPFAPSTGLPIFSSSSNGLASGNTLEEATLHGLFEVLERDCVTLNEGRDASRWVDPRELPRALRRMADRWSRLGIELAVRQLPNEFGLPCFSAALVESTNAVVRIAEGSGLHSQRAIALTRAICEAAQSRLAQIHGGRDDITTFYRKLVPSRRASSVRKEADEIRRLFDQSRSTRLRAVGSVEPRRIPIATLLEGIVASLGQQGFDRVYRHRFRLPLNGLHVVKVVVPKCEHASHHATRMGPRLMARIVGSA